MAKILSVRLTDNDENMLAALTDQMGITPSGVIREAIEQLHRQLGGKKNPQPPAKQLELPKKPPGFKAPVKPAAKPSFGAGR